MIIVEGWVRVEDGGEIDRLREAAIEMMRATKAAEEGCLEYAYAVDVANPALLRVIERWVDDEALSAHFATAHMATFRQAIATAKVSAVSIKAYSGQLMRTLMER